MSSELPANRLILKHILVRHKPMRTQYLPKLLLERDGLVMFLLPDDIVAYMFHLVIRHREGGVAHSPTVKSREVTVMLKSDATALLDFPDGVGDGYRDRQINEQMYMIPIAVDTLQMPALTLAQHVNELKQLTFMGLWKTFDVRLRAEDNVLIIPAVTHSADFCTQR